ncbi:uncharacterized protein BJ171DRAFT_276364 [Polychytrium aggregatum]|uniref:uncharacterized protein n=1 Tax=Polychytrium aggregatum TaxID=110093 RepID=UPI0022FEC292|nr:uncharacterized protein BJ171DRAFT_276364 [Polychytrium aggregatum]KAI9207489.1 hypothetical protein BJ171DRAFT_276364 [Polychytrium aggregatum]
MFSSAFTIKAEARLRSGSRKKLKTELTSRFPSLAFDDGRSLNALLPSSQKSGQPLNETSVDIITATGQTGTVVLVDGEPMFYRDGHEGIIPTVYALWKVPHLCQLQIETTDIRDSKSQEQLGIDEVHGLPERDLNYQPGEPVVLTVSRDGKRVAYGVGITLASKSEISSGKKKKFARIVHVYGDHLWCVSLNGALVSALAIACRCY